VAFVTAFGHTAKVEQRPHPAKGLVSSTNCCESRCESPRTSRRELPAVLGDLAMVPVRRTILPRLGLSNGPERQFHPRRVPNAGQQGSLRHLRGGDSAPRAKDCDSRADLARHLANDPRWCTQCKLSFYVTSWSGW